MSRVGLMSSTSPMVDDELLGDEFVELLSDGGFTAVETTDFTHTKGSGE